jgi:colanic acid biosynthesis glycosyl transferase WcaI
MLLKKRLPIVGAPIGRHYIRMEERMLRASSAVVPISADFIPLLRDIGVEERKIHLQENWGPLEEVQVKPRKTDWAEQHGYGDTFNFVYSGSLGMKHNPKLLLDLASAFKDRKDVRVIVITQGVARPWLARERNEMGLKNLDILDYQPYEQMSEVMASADVLVAVLEPSAGIFSVPSKVLSCLCGGRPLLLAVPAENLAAQIVRSSEAGLIAPPTSSELFVTHAETLYADKPLREKMGLNGRAYAERTFDIERVADHFLEIFSASSPQLQLSMDPDYKIRKAKPVGENIAADRQP